MDDAEAHAFAPSSSSAGRGAADPHEIGLEVLVAQQPAEDPSNSAGPGAGPRAAAPTTISAASTTDDPDSAWALLTGEWKVRSCAGPPTGSFQISRVTRGRRGPGLVASGMIPVRAWCGCWGWREHSFTGAELERTELFALIDQCGGPTDADGVPRDVFIFGKHHLLAIHSTSQPTPEVVVREVPDMIYEVACQNFCGTTPPCAFYSRSVSVKEIGEVGASSSE